MGIPLDLTCSTSGGSSIYWCKRWIQTPVVIRTKTGRVHRIMDQVVGFVPRSTSLLIVGQQACSLCGYKTIQQQDRELDQLLAATAPAEQLAQDEIELLEEWHAGKEEQLSDLLNEAETKSCIPTPMFRLTRATTCSHECRESEGVQLSSKAAMTLVNHHQQARSYPVRSTAHVVNIPSVETSCSCKRTNIQTMAYARHAACWMPEECLSAADVMVIKTHGKL